MKHAGIKEAVFPLNEIRAQACSRKIKEAVQRVGGQYSSPIPHAQLLEIQSEPRNEHQFCSGSAMRMQVAGASIPR